MHYLNMESFIILVTYKISKLVYYSYIKLQMFLDILLDYFIRIEINMYICEYVYIFLYIICTYVCNVNTKNCNDFNYNFIYKGRNMSFLICNIKSILSFNTGKKCVFFHSLLFHFYSDFKSWKIEIHFLFEFNTRIKENNKEKVINRF